MASRLFAQQFVEHRSMKTLKFRDTGLCEGIPPVTGGFPSQGPGSCITTATWRCRNNFSQWERSFLGKLRCHWLKELWQRQIAVVRKSPVTRKMFPFDDIIMPSIKKNSVNIIKLLLKFHALQIKFSFNIYLNQILCKALLDYKAMKPPWTPPSNIIH